MGSKYDSFNEDVFFTFFTLSGLYFLSGNKYINLYTFVSILVAKHGGQILHKLLIHKDENKSFDPPTGNSTPWNPLKIPMKNITPAKHHIPPAPKPSGGSTPWNPLKIPGKNLTPAKHN